MVLLPALFALAGLRGETDVVSFGIAQITPDDARAVAAVHVRETFHNSDTLPWTVDVAAETLSFGEATPAVHPLFANADAATLPLVIIAPGERRVVDLYFPTGEGDLPGLLVLTYRIATPDRTFEAGMALHKGTRRLVEVTPAVGGGAGWWSDPGYAWATFYRRPGRAVPRPPVHVEITRVPRAFYEATPAEFNWPRTDECNEW